MLGGQGAGSVGADRVLVDQGAEVLVVERTDLAELVGGAEPVEEVQERARVLRSVAACATQREVLRLLHRLEEQSIAKPVVRAAMTSE